jgi:hypothetical protein
MHSGMAFSIALVQLLLVRLSNTILPFFTVLVLSLAERVAELGKAK